MNAKISRAGILNAILIALSISFRPALGSEAEPLSRDVNPALLYYRAFLLAPTLEKADWDFLYNTNDWRGQQLPERFGELVAKYDAQFELVRRAARARVPCDWGLDMSAGAQTLVEHLARAKAVAQTGRFRVMWDLQQGRQTEAKADWLATFVLGRNVSRDGTMISVLVQIAMEAIDCSLLADTYGQWSAETLKELADGIDAAPAAGTVAASIGTEKTLFRDPMRRKILQLQGEHPGDDPAVLQWLRRDLGGVEDESGKPSTLWERLTQAAGGTSAGIVRLLEEREPVYQRVATILALPWVDYQRQVDGLKAEIEKSANPFITESFPALLRGKSREIRIEVWLAMVRAAIEYKLRGEPGLRTVTDPCGTGPFEYERFPFQGIDRGFQLRSAYSGSGYPEVLIFVEKPGPPFRVDGPKAGQPIRRESAGESFQQRYGPTPSK